MLIAVAGGLALYASSPPVDAWPLAVAGPGLLVVALAGRSLRASFGCGLAFGLATFVPLLSWLVNEAWYAWAALAGAEAVILAVLAIDGVAVEGLNDVRLFVGVALAGDLELLFLLGKAVDDVLHADAVRLSFYKGAFSTLSLRRQYA